MTSIGRVEIQIIRHGGHIAILKMPRRIGKQRRWRNFETNTRAREAYASEEIRLEK
jgi:hypothetical protein